MFNLSQHQGSFPNELVLSTRWPKYWSFSFIISSFNEFSELISIDWFDVPEVQGTLRSHLQHHNLKASILCLYINILKYKDIFYNSLANIFLLQYTYICFILILYGFNMTCLNFNNYGIYFIMSGNRHSLPRFSRFS